MASKKSGKSSAVKTKSAKTQPTDHQADVSVETKATNSKRTCSFLAALFARKFDPTENILTIFKRPSTYAALIAEFLGTFLLAAFFLTVGVQSPLFIIFVVLAITLTFYSLSGAHFNPLITVGMMATRRISAIRGVLYILAQILGAWFSFFMLSSFAGAAGKGENSPLQSMSKLVNDKIGVIIAIELIGAILVGLFYARALFYKKHAFMFSAIVAGGIMVAMLIMLVSSNMQKLNNNFILNPAVAMVYQILPSSATEFGSAIKDIALALSIYFVIPMLGGTIGFYLSDLTAKLAGEELK